MKHPTIPIASMIVLVALAGLDLAAFSQKWGDERDLLLWLVPTANLVLVGLMILTRQFANRDRLARFWIGVVAAGAFGSGSLTLTWLILRAQTEAYVREGSRSLAVFWDNYIKVTGGFTLAYWTELNRTFQWLAVAVPLVAFTTLGGWLAARLDRFSAPIRLRQTLIAVAGGLLIAQAGGIGLLGRWRSEYLSEASRYESSRREHDARAREAIRSAEALDLGFADRRLQFEKWRALADQEYQAAHRATHFEWKFRAAARSPWRPVAPESPPR